MADIATTYDNDLLTGDLGLADGLLAMDEGLQTAILHSLFTDARALESDPIETGEAKRGWWGDLVAPNDGDKYGSRLWLLRREKQTAEVLLRASEYAEESLAWLISDGLASKVTVTASYPSRGVLHLAVEITLTSGALETFDFDYDMGGTSAA